MQLLKGLNYDFRQLVKLEQGKGYRETQTDVKQVVCLFMKQSGIQANGAWCLSMQCSTVEFELVQNWLEMMFVATIEIALVNDWGHLSPRKRICTVN